MGLGLGGLKGVLFVLVNIHNTTRLVHEYRRE